VGDVHGHRGPPGLEALGDAVVAEEINGRTYWSVPRSASVAHPPSPAITLLQDYDEYVSDTPTAVT